MKKLLLALVAVLAISNVEAGCCPKKRKKCETKTERCEPKPKCVKRCVVEKCVEPRKVCETICHYECPTDCEVAGGDYQPMSKDVTRKGKRMSNNY